MKEIETSVWVSTMKVDKDVQKWLVENLTDWLNNFYDTMKHWIEKIGEAETAEDIMRCKRDMLMHYVNSMPIHPYHCYFCLLYNADDCEEVLCEYGVLHGFCNDKASDHASIRRLRNKLRRALQENYYRGESYGVSDMEGV